MCSQGKDRAATGLGRLSAWLRPGFGRHQFRSTSNLLTGSLAKTEHVSPILWERLRRYRSFADQHPHIYVRHLTVGRAKEDLTVKLAINLARWIGQYVSCEAHYNDDARKVDQAMDPTWQKVQSDRGLRALIHNSKGEVDPMKKQILLTFGNTLKKFAEQAGPDPSKRIPPMHYIGYSNNHTERKKAHDSLNSKTD